MKPRITISMPCFGRPLRTRRAIKCILDQTVYDWEAFIIGDNCRYFDSIQKEGLLDDKRIISFNNHKNYGGCGYWATNYAIQNASGDYFIFFANDDFISPVHMQVYLEAIEESKYDFVYFDYIAFGKLMKTKIRYAHIGHSALIIRTSFLKYMPPHSPEYGHDYDLIKNMIRAGAIYKKAERIIPTYYVMSGNKKRQIDPDGID